MYINGVMTEVVEERACDIDTIRKLFTDNPKLVLVYTGQGCTRCEPFMETVKEELKDKPVTLAEIELGKGEYECELAADAFDVRGTPTLLYFKEGKLVKRISPSGEKDKDIDALRRLDENADKALQDHGGEGSS